MGEIIKKGSENTTQMNKVKNLPKNMPFEVFQLTNLFKRQFDKILRNRDCLKHII